MVRSPLSEFRMKRPSPRTPAQWLKEIKLAIADAAEAAPFGPLVGTEITAANLFHLAPVVCLKFRGKKLKGREANRVTKVAWRTTLRIPILTASTTAWSNGP